MSKTRLQLVNICKRKTKDTSSTSESGFQEDLDTALGIVDSILNRDKGDIKATLNLIAGTESYPLPTNVDTLNQFVITPPATGSKLTWVGRDIFRLNNPDTSTSSHGVPSYWYEIEPTIDGATNVETKNINVFPIPDVDYVATYTYIKSLPIMVTNAAYPSFNGKYHHILADYAIWQYYERETDESGNPMYWQNKWEKDLEWVIETYPRSIKYLAAISGPDQLESD